MFFLQPTNYSLQTRKSCPVVKKNIFSANHGFTLLEVLLVIASITLIAGIGMPVYQSFQVKNDLDVATNTIAQSLHRAQLLAEANDGDTNWGVGIVGGSIVVFKGASYAGRDSAYDEIFSVPTSITPSGLSEIVFAKFTGLPQSTGTTTLTSTTNEVRTLNINSRGTVS